MGVSMSMGWCIITGAVMAVALYIVCYYIFVPVIT